MGDRRKSKRLKKKKLRNGQKKKIHQGKWYNGKVSNFWDGRVRETGDGCVGEGRFIRGRVGEERTRGTKKMVPGTPDSQGKGGVVGGGQLSKKKVRLDVRFISDL